MKLHKNIRLWYISSFFSFTAFVLPIWLVFGTDVLDFSNTQAIVLGVAPWGMSSLLEIPTGSWADRFGRARIYQLGKLLYVLSVASFIFATNFTVLLIFQLIGALGLAMQSGSIEALIHDSLPQNKNTPRLFQKVHSKKMAILFTSRTLTVLAGGWLFSVNPRLPFIIATLSYSLAFIVSLFLVEIRVEHATANSSLSHIKETWKILSSKRTMLLFLLLVVLYSAVSEALFVLYQPYFKSIGIEIGSFGLFYMVISGMSALGAVSIVWLSKHFNPFQLLATMILAVWITLASMLLRNPIVTYFAIIPSSLAFGYLITLMNTYIQSKVSSKHQSTAISIGSFFWTIAFMISTTLLGIGLDIWGAQRINWILVVMSSVFLLTASLCVRTVREKIIQVDEISYASDDRDLPD